MEMELSSELLKTAGAGGLLALLFQAFKSDAWGVWPTRLLAAGVAGSAGTVVGGGMDAGLVTALAAIATHALMLADNKLGGALKLNLLVVILDTVAQLASALSKSLKREG